MFSFSTLRQTGRCFAGLVLGLLGLACGSGDAEHAEGDWVLPEAARQTYVVDCQAACEVELRCKAWPDQQHCLEECQGMAGKGGLQAVYLDSWAECLLDLPARCSQVDLDDCRRLAMAGCQRPGELDGLLEAWCTQWLECNGAPVGPYLDRCLGDVENLPDMALMACMSPEALLRFGDCAAAADCQTLSDWPLLQLCWSVYW